MTIYPPLVDVALTTLDRNEEAISELREERRELVGVVYHSPINREKSSYINKKIQDLKEINEALRHYVNQRISETQMRKS